MPRVIKVIESSKIRKCGDIWCGITQYHTLDGKLLAEKPPFEVEPVEDKFR